MNRVQTQCSVELRYLGVTVGEYIVISSGICHRTYSAHWSLPTHFLEQLFGLLLPVLFPENIFCLPV